MPPRKTRAEATADAGRTNADVQAALDAAGAVDKLPEAPEPPDDLVKLPGGLIRNGKTIKTAVVRELNGQDEEALSRAVRSNVFHFMDVLIARGTETIGDEPATKDNLKNLLIGDRDELALAIRCATYGDDFSVDSYECPHCGVSFPFTFSLKDEDVVGRKKLSSPADAVFDVDLRKGAKARVRLPNGADQVSLFENEDWTTAERNSRLLSKCVLTYTDPAGQEFQVVAMPSIILNLGIPDRQKIISEITKRQPGPKYNEIRFTHDECGNEVNLALGIQDLFRDLIVSL